MIIIYQFLFSPLIASNHNIFTHAIGSIILMSCGQNPEEKAKGLGLSMLCTALAHKSRLWAIKMIDVVQYPHGILVLHSPSLWKKKKHTHTHKLHNRPTKVDFLARVWRPLYHDDCGHWGVSAFSILVLPHVNKRCCQYGQMLCCQYGQMLCFNAGRHWGKTRTCEPGIVYSIRHSPT